jgi:hypothetical protein
MTLTAAQVKREDAARAELEEMGWSVNFVREAQEQDDFLGRSAIARQVCVSKPVGHNAIRKVITGPSFVFCLADARGWQSYIDRLKPEFRPVSGDGVVPVIVQHPGDTAQTRRTPKIRQIEV